MPAGRRRGGERRRSGRGRPRRRCRAARADEPAPGRGRAALPRLGDEVRPASAVASPHGRRAPRGRVDRAGRRGLFQDGARGGGPGCRACREAAIAPARPVAGHHAASSSAVPSAVRAAPRPALNSGSSSSCSTVAQTASSAVPPGVEHRCAGPVGAGQARARSAALLGGELLDPTAGAAVQRERPAVGPRGTSHRAVSARRGRWTPRRASAPAGLAGDVVHGDERAEHREQVVAADARRARSAVRSTPRDPGRDLGHVGRSGRRARGWPGARCRAAHASAGDARAPRASRASRISRHDSCRVQVARR